MKAFLTEWNPLSSATATEDQELFSLLSDPEDFDLAEDNLDDNLDNMMMEDVVAHGASGSGDGDAALTEEASGIQGKATPLIPKIEVSGDDDNAEVAFLQLRPHWQHVLAVYFYDYRDPLDIP